MPRRNERTLRLRGSGPVMSSLVPPMTTTPIRTTLRADCVRAVPGQTPAAMPIEAKSFRRLIMLYVLLAEILHFVTSTEYVEQGADKDEATEAGLSGLKHRQTLADMLSSASGRCAQMRRREF